MRRIATNNYLPRALLVLLAAAVLAAGLLALVGVKPAWAALSFVPAQNFEVGNATPSVTADFNGDGKVDLAATNTASDSVSVLFGNGDGTFQAKRDFAVGGKPSSVTSADFNGDNKTDLATANLTSGNISILLGNGDGTFQAAQNSALGITDSYSGGYDTVTSTDFNGDNKTDLATANYSSDSVSVLLGKGDGTFEAVQSFSVGDTPVSVASADFNGDNKADLVTANDPLSSSLPNGVSVLLGKGDGTFHQPAQSFSAGIDPKQVITADFNGDSKADIATANWGSIWTGGGSVSVYLGNGDGKFQDPFNVVEDREDHAYHPSSVTATDFDRDGNVDLAATDENGFGDPSDALVLLGYGDGTFQNPQTFAVEEYPGFVIGADLNADSYADLAVAGSHPRLSSDPPRNYVSVLLNIPAPDDTTAPTVGSVSPADAESDVALTANVEASFSEAIDPQTLTSDNPDTATFTLTKTQDPTGPTPPTPADPVVATVSYDDATNKATLDPASDLEANTTYTATIKSGSDGVKDLAGNELEQDYSWTFTTTDSPPADTQAPSAPTISSPQNNTYDTDGSFSVSGSAEAGSTVELFEGTTSKGTTKIDSPEGAWSIPLSGVSEGSHTYSAKATDAAGNTSSASNTVTVTVDTKAPSPPTITSPADNSYDTDGNITFSGTAEKGSTVKVYQDGATTAAGPQATASTTDGSWTISLTGVSEQSTAHTFGFTATDAAGNESTATTRHVTVQKAPKAPSGLTALQSGTTTSQNIKLAWTDNSDNEKNFVLERSTNQTNWTVLSSTLVPNTTSYTDTKNLSKRTKYYYRVKATNDAGSSAYSNVASATTK